MSVGLLFNYDPGTGIEQMWLARRTAPGVWNAAVYWDSTANPPVGPSFQLEIETYSAGASSDPSLFAHIGLMVGLTFVVPGHNGFPVAYSVPGNVVPSIVDGTNYPAVDLEEYWGPINGAWFNQGFWWALLQYSTTSGSLGNRIRMMKSADQATWVGVDTTHDPLLYSADNQAAWFYDASAGVLRAIYVSGVDGSSHNIFSLIEFTITGAGTGSWGSAHDGSSFSLAGGSQFGSFPIYVVYAPSTGITHMIFQSTSAAIWYGYFSSGSWTFTEITASSNGFDSGFFLLDPNGTTTHFFYLAAGSSILKYQQIQSGGVLGPTHTFPGYLGLYGCRGIIDSGSLFVPGIASDGLSPACFVSSGPLSNPTWPTNPEIVLTISGVGGTYSEESIMIYTSGGGPPPPPLTLACPISTQLIVGVPYDGFLVAAGGTPPYTFGIIGGALPPGLTLNFSTGEISGTPTTVGVYTYTAQVTDSQSPPATDTVTCGFSVTRSLIVGAQTLRFQIASPGRPARWFPHLYADEVTFHYWVEPNSSAPNTQELFMLSGGQILVSGGDTDNGVDIVVVAEPPSIDSGDQRAQKLYVDAMTEADGTGAIAAQIRFNNSQQVGPTISMAPTGLRQQFLENISSLMNLSLYRNISVRWQWTGGPDGPRIYSFEPSGYLQPYLSSFMVTQFFGLSFPGWKHMRRLFPGIISNSDILFTVKCQDDRVFGPYTIPSTGGQFRIVPQMLDHGLKDLAFALQLDGQGQKFALFLDEFTIETKSWTESSYISLASWKA